MPANNGISLKMPAYAEVIQTICTASSIEASPPPESARTCGSEVTYPKIAVRTTSAMVMS